MTEKKKLYGNYKKLQDIYEEGGLFSEKFYHQTIAYVKKLLNKYLWQKQFGEDHINDCFVSVYEKVSRNYDSEKGALGTFIHTIIRNYCTKVNYRLQNHPTPISLDFEYINKEELCRNSNLTEDDSIEDEEVEDDADLDNVEYYCTDLQCEDALDEVEYYCDLLRQYDNIKELSNKDFENIDKIEAIKRDLLWNIWKQQLRLL